ncbi:GtrA family protein [Paenibacillus sp. 481]|uniref:GtrA family protein n=1 Tax=Paenibacillus sp. 481 TaxID=2835869 RepID=UPI001E3DB679|nr:GtrA family protein [Paenibacillus sp. 481]
MKPHPNMATLFSRYALIGIVNTIVGLGTIYIFLYVFGWSHLASTFTGNAVGIGCSYVLNRRYTFQGQGPSLRSLLRFIGVSLGCYVVAYVLLHSGITAAIAVVLSILPTWAASWQTSLVVLVEAGIYTIISFLIHRAYTFKIKKG